MSKKNQRLNSRNTDNPYELISGVKLISKDNKHINVAIYADEYKCIYTGKGKRKLIMSSFTVKKVMRSNKGSDYLAVKLFRKVGKFAKRCHNPLEVITLFTDAYKANKNDVDIKFIPCPVYTDALDSKFIYDSLIKNKK